MGVTRPEKIEVGPLSLQFEPWSGWLREVRVGGLEAVRAVYCAVRGPDWGTFDPLVEVTRHEVSPEAFWLEWKVEVPGSPVRWTGTLHGDAQGLEYRVTVVADTPFETQRTGLCLLHPAEAAGSACRVLRTDGATQAGSFPARISPHQPYQEIATIEHLVGRGRWVRVAFEGEVFEMEDQRNWTDASFKTYCRPLDWPRPYPLTPGQPFTHAVRISWSETGESVAVDPEVRLTIASARHQLPSLGTVQGEAVADPAFDFVLTDSDRADRPAHVWVRSGDVWPQPPGAVRVRVSDERRLPEARRQYPALPVFYASDHNYTELNREPPSASVDGLAFAMNPQVHAFDDRSVAENALTIGTCVQDARVKHPGLPVSAGPITFGSSRRGSDPRLNSPFGLGWTVSALAAAASAGAESIVLHSTDDWTEALQPLLTALAGKPDEVGEVRSSAPHRVSALLLLHRGVATTFVANLTGEPQTAWFGALRLELGPWEVRVVTA